MNTHDIIMAICSFGFSIAVFMQVFSLLRLKKANQISFIAALSTSLLLLIMTITFLDLKMYLTFVASLIQCMAAELERMGKIIAFNVIRNKYPSVLAKGLARTEPLIKGD